MRKNSECKHLQYSSIGVFTTIPLNHEGAKEVIAAVEAFGHSCGNKEVSCRYVDVRVNKIYGSSVYMHILCYIISLTASYLENM